MQKAHYFSAEGLSLLKEIAMYHRDRGEYPTMFFDTYVNNRAANKLLLDQYNDSICKMVEKHGKQLQVDASPDAMKSLGAFEFSMGPSLLKKFQALPLQMRLAHMYAKREVENLYFDISSNLASDASSDSRLLSVYSELAGRFTKDNLLPLQEDLVLGYAWVSYRDHDIHLHPGFRRGFRSGINAELVSSLRALHERGLYVSIAPDHGHLCLRGDILEIHELDHWFGRPFRYDSLDDPHAVGKTVHTRTKDMDLQEKAGLQTQFTWTFKDGLKSLILEELPIIGAPLLHGFVACRFIHAQRDITNKRFIHLDGAVALYDGERYIRRRRQAEDGSIDPIKADRKIKLFRIDVSPENALQRIPEDEWAKTITQFFRGNELVLEYLSGKSFEMIYAEEFGIPYPFTSIRAKD